MKICQPFLDWIAAGEKRVINGAQSLSWFSHHLLSSCGSGYMIQAGKGSENHRGSEAQTAAGPKRVSCESTWPRQSSDRGQQANACPVESLPLQFWKLAKDAVGFYISFWNTEEKLNSQGRGSLEDWVGIQYLGRRCVGLDYAGYNSHCLVVRESEQLSGHNLHLPHRRWSPSSWIVNNPMPS